MCDAQTVWGCPDRYSPHVQTLYGPDLLIQRVCLWVLRLDVLTGYYSPLRSDV